MARFKYLSATLLALFLSLASCSNNPASSGDPSGNPPEGGGGSNPPAETLDKALFTFSALFADQEDFSSKTIGEFTLSASVGTGRNTPKYYNNGSNLRFYNGNIFTISGTKMTEINFNAEYKNSGTVTASVGTFADHKWTGDATSVTFTIGTDNGDATDGQYRIVALGVNQSADDTTGGGGDTGGGDDTSTVTTATFLPSHFSGQGTSGSGSAMSATVSGVTLSTNKGYGADEVRIYAGANLTISSSHTITAIAFTFSSGKTGGLLSNITGLSTTSWEQTLASQLRFSQCVVTYSSNGDDTGGGVVPGGGGEESTYTALSVFKDLVLSFTGNSMSDTDAATYWDKDYLEYIIGFDRDTTSETTLEAAVKEAIDYLPEYLVINEEAASGTWDDGSDGWFATLSTDDGSVTVILGSYIEDGYVVLNVEVFEE